MANQAAFDPLTYWEERHTRLRGAERSVGNIALSDEQNRQLFEEKARLLRQHLERLFPSPRGHRLLDVGCGIGLQTRAFAALGFDSVGIDFSPTAIAEARRLGGARFHVADVRDFTPEAPFDACTCIDVMYHIVEDHLWSGALRVIALCLRPQGCALIVEHFPETTSRSPHVVWRNLDAYRAALAAAGLRLVATEVFVTPVNQARKSLLVARRQLAQHSVRSGR